jgi:hypothetical protein
MWPETAGLRFFLKEPEKETALLSIRKTENKNRKLTGAGLQH